MTTAEAVASLLIHIPGATVEFIDGAVVEISCTERHMDALLAAAKRQGWRRTDANQGWAALRAPASVAAATLAQQGLDPRDMTLAEILDELLGGDWEVSQDHPYANAVLAAYEGLA